jgi:O-antigen/teichoic acid export membrane protein
LIKITKEDVIWNYAGSILNLGMNVIILPFVLRILSTEELGLWYVFGSISALVSLLDFGFSPSIMRNIICLERR